MTSEQIDKREKEIRAKAIALNNGEYCGCAKFFTQEDKEELNELEYRRMIIACVCYGEDYDIFDEKNHCWGEYGIKYGFSKFGYEKALTIWRNQKEFFETHAIVHKGVHTDYEGCTYNSIEWNC